MRSISIIFPVVGLILGISGPAFSQGGGFGSGGGIGSGGAGATVSTAMIAIGAPQSCSGYGSGMNGDGEKLVYSFRFGSCFAVGAVTDAPYSGHSTTEFVRTLPDGTHLTQPTTSQPMTYRDSMGRTRTERGPISGPLFGTRNPNAPARPVQPVVAEINDPVSGFHYILDPVNQVAHRVKVIAKTTPMPAEDSGSSTSTMPNGATSTRESLGTQVMFGVTVVGTRTTMVYPPGTYQGNDRPVMSVSEMWQSPQYRLVLLSKNTAVDGGDSTTSMKDFSTASPDPVLFQVPAGYQIVDEANEFTFTIPLATK